MALSLTAPFTVLAISSIVLFKRLLTVPLDVKYQSVSIGCLINLSPNPFASVEAFVSVQSSVFNIEKVVSGIATQVTLSPELKDV